MQLRFSDEERMAGLMRAAMAGDEAAYAEFLRSTAALVRAVARRRLSESAVVSPEDVVQETLLAIHSKRHTWRQAEPILPWVFTIVRYKIVDVYRRRGRHVHVDVEEIANDPAFAEHPSRENGDRYLERALDSLTEGQQRVVRAIAVDGQSIAETAGSLGMKETAVRVAFHRGLAAIARKFGRPT